MSPKPKLADKLVQVASIQPAVAHAHGHMIYRYVESASNLRAGSRLSGSLV